MTASEILTQRLANQRLSSSTFKKPEQVVEYMGAMQAQEYAMSKWAIGLRLPASNDTQVEKAFNEGRILRTHLLRPTWHFVSPNDIRWILKLTAPRIHVANGFMCRKFGLTDAVLKKALVVIEKMLTENRYLTRNALGEQLKKKKIIGEGQLMAYIMMHAELVGLVCSGPRQGKQFTYALLEERAKSVPPLSHEESVSELANRYFKSRGPATLKDYTTWSGLTVKDAKAGIGSLGKNFIREVYKGTEYIFPDGKIKKELSSFLMPDYDEYGMGYKDRGAIFNEKKYREQVSRGNPVFNRMIIIDGVIEGTWQRRFEKNKVVVDTFPFPKLSIANQKKLQQAINRYLAFNGNAKE